MDMVAGALARLDAMTAKTPHDIDTLNPVYQPNSLQARQCPVERDPIESADLRIGSDLLMRKGTANPIERLENHSPSSRAFESRRL